MAVERSSENHGIKSTQYTLKSKKEEVHRFTCFYKSQFSSFATCDQKTRPSKISPTSTMHRAPHISLNTECRLWVTVSSRRNEFSDFTSILARWTRLRIYCTHACRTCTCRAWLSLHPLFSTCPLLGTYLLTTYTYKHIRFITRVYGMMKFVH